MSPSRPRAKSFALLRVACLAAIVTLALGPRAIRSADDIATVDAFLGRLGLVDLQLRLHEQTLDKSSRGAAQQAAARRLADLFAAALLSADDPVRADALRRRIERLLEQFPDAGTGALQVSLAQADYQRAEKLILAWLEDPRAATSRQEAGKLLDRVVPLLDQQHAALKEAADKLAEHIDRTPNELARAELDARWQREQAVVARAGYLAAWAHYYAGLFSQPNPLAEPHFHAAQQAFREVLGVAEVKEYAEVDGESLGLESLARARAVVGLGLAEAARAQAVEADQVFHWLAGATVHPTIREQADYWRLQSRLNVRRWKEALDGASERAPSLAAPATPGKVSFFVSLVRAAYAVPPAESFGGTPRDPQATPDAATRQRLGDLGLQGLLRLRQLGLLRELVSKYEIPVDANAPLPLIWARGDQLFRDAEKANDTVKYQEAVLLLTTALARPAAGADIATAGRCRWTLAWCRYRLMEYEAAAKLFQSASLGMRELDPKTAVEGAWMAFASYQHLLADQPTLRGTAIEILENLQRDFPGTPRSQQAGLQLARLQQSSASPEDALRTLAKIRPEDSQYAAASYEICRLEHQAWSKAKKSGPAAAEAKRLLEAVDRFIKFKSNQKSPTPDDDERVLKAGLLAADALSSDEYAAATLQFAQQLDALESRTQRLPATSPSLVEYHYRRLQLAQREANDDGAHAAAEWLTRKGIGSPFELPAVVLRARRIDEQIAKAAPGELPALQREAVRLYARLVTLWGDSPERLREKKNTLIANSKLANYLYETGQFADAAVRFQRLLAAYPQDKAILRRSALADQRTGNPAGALDKWRTLLAGLDKGSYDWFEAKFGQLECLAETEPGKAAEIFAQFRLLYPELGPSEWRGKFQQLELRIAGRPSTSK